MTKITRTALLPYSVEQLFDLVNDVAQYPVFLPWCKATTIHYQSDCMMNASISIHKAGVTKIFATENTLIYPHQIKMQFKEGPFKKLVGDWCFTPLGSDGCKIVFNLEFEFNVSIVGRMLHKIFESAASDMVDAFSERARKIYG